ncbi:MAG: sudA 4 [Dehalococcoidia bacterium]|nr:sudA 4 [Dehalococcoidia bacterium]
MTTKAVSANAKRLIAPCMRDCPAGIDVPRYIGYVQKGQFAEAEAVVREKNPFPAICSHVCYRHCEVACRRASMDGTVSINALKRAACDLRSEMFRDNWEATIAPSTGKRVAVVGSGPAGLTVAYYLGKRCGHQVTVFEALSQAGGQFRIGIPVYRLPREILDEQIAVVTETRVEIKTNHRVESLDKLFQEGFDAIFIGAGALRPQQMGIEGEDLPGVMECVDFLQEVNLGNNLDVGQRVAIIGGGNVAIDGARTALRLGAKEVTIVYRRTRQEMPATADEVQAAEKEGVKFQFLVSPMGVYRDGDHLRLHLQCMELGEPDDSGRRRPVPIKGKETDLPINTLLVAIGQVADVAKSWGIDLNRNGTIQGDNKSMATNRAGVFAGGDVITGPSNVTEAIAAGRRSASAMDRYLGGDGDIEETLAPPPGDEMDMPSKLHPLGVKAFPVAELDVKERIHTFDEVERGYTRDEAIQEARRCIRCDMWRINGIPSVWPKGKKVIA